ncbi:substrate-binding periplasmic protein [Stutzerimonas tarimensis]|uniref:Substrate-binding periplasmic protein n=1 Tax=Stutzerimonas tarimensis TaxID=1507735 RepID=A0ABV7T965_9GAMM
MRLAVALMASLGLASSAAVAAGKCDRLIATGAEENPPFLWRDPDQPDRLIGANADLLKRLADALELKLVMLHTGDAGRALEEARDGRVDLLVDATLLSERLEQFDYVHPAVTELQLHPWVRQGDTRYYAGREHLAGRRGVWVGQEALGQQFEAFSKAYLSLDRATDLPAALNELVAGKVDYVLHERYSGIAAVASAGLIDEVEVLAPPVLAQGMHLAISHNSACNDAWLRGQLALKMTELRAGGVPQKLLAENLERWLDQQRGTDEAEGEENL